MKWRKKAAASKRGSVPSVSLKEIEGYIDLGMVPEVLRGIRQILRNSLQTAAGFNTAVGGLLVHGERLKRWTPHAI